MGRFNFEIQYFDNSPIQQLSVQSLINGS